MTTRTETKKTVQMELDSTIVYQPRWLDESKQRIKAIVRAPDGRLAEFEAVRSDKKSLLTRDIFLQYSVEQIDLFTKQERELVEWKSKIDLQAMEDRQKAEEREVTFQAKTKALELPEVKNCPDKCIARKIRKSKSAFEVAGWLAVVFMKTLEAEEKSEE